MCSDTQSFWTLRDHMDCSPPASSGHGTLQVRIPEWVAISSSRGSSGLRDQTHISCLSGRFFTTEPLGKLTQRVIIDERHVIVCYCCCNRFHTFSGLKQHRLFYSSVGQKSEMGLSGLNESVGRADLFWRLWGRIYLHVCLVSGSHHLLWLLVPFLHFHIQQSRAKSLSLCHPYQCFSASFFYY